MAKNHCVYHPEKAANWNCVKCGTLVCQECFPAAADPIRHPYCTLCGGDMHHLGISGDLPSFWLQTPSFFAYPFSMNGLIFLALLALLSMASVKMFATAGMLVLLPVFIIVSLVIRQGLRVIEFCSQGRSKPPGIADLFDGNSSTLKMIGLVVVYGMATAALGHLGLLGVVAMFGLSALIPASIMLLAIHGSLRTAISPIQVVDLAVRTGWSYIGLIVVLMLVSQGPQQAMALLPEETLQRLAQESPHVLAALVVVFSTYFNMVMGAMMGYLLFQNHHDLGISPDDEHKAAPVDMRALALARAVILVRESRFEDALRHMAGTVSDFPNDLQVLEYYHKLLSGAGGDAERMAQHTERYLTALAAAGRKGRMPAAFEAARRVAPKYLPKSIPLRTALAEQYFQQRQFKRAVDLIGMLHKEAPTSSDLPAAYLLLARIYSEGLRDDAKAGMILDFVLERFAEHPLAPEVANYRKVLQSLAKPAQAA